ncbi:MAG: hypothetical protein JXD23_05260 [Spirochaetales bacterium]|nr:hypothetical protein [Spirochaetales bacterium]
MKRVLFTAGGRVVLFAVFFTACIPVVFAAPPKASSSGGSARREISLNGTWETAVTADPAYPPRVVRWQQADIPVLTYGNAISGTRYVWYRKDVTIPESFGGMKIDLLLAGARFNASVWCDGRFAGCRLGGYTPFTVDLTDRVKPGASVRLEIRCQDWSAVFKDNYRLPEDADPDGERLRGVPKGKLISPIGGHFYFFGFWDDVSLLARPKAYCDDVAIETSVRKNNTLTVTGLVAGARGKLWIEGSVLDEGKIVLALPGRETSANGRFSLTAPFPKVRYWSPEDPHRYTLVLSLKDGKGGSVLDRYEERFGFRELWADGPDLFLNGVKRRLLASSGWPEARYQSAEEIRRGIAGIRESNAVAFRLHTQPWQRRWLEEADALGLMIVEEGALWCDGGGGYAYDDDRFWQNVRAHLAGMVSRDRNHPSLVMWSIENELLHCGASGKCPCAEERLAEAGRQVKALDPTHLITYEADHDPGGAADVIGLHYPRELPDVTDYPNTADWLGTTVATGTAGGTAGSWNKDFFWDRKKPLYIGEYLWVFQQDYSPGSVFYGDEAYVEREEYRVKAKADAWLFQTIAYRRAGVSGMCPWTIAGNGGQVDKTSPLYAAQKRAYKPVAIFPREYDSRFFAGERVKRSFDVFNDSVTPVSLETRFTLAGKSVGRAERFILEPAGHRVVTVTLAPPGRSAPTGLVFTADLFAAGGKIDSFETRCRIFTRTALAVPAGRRLLVFDPKGAWPAGRIIKGTVTLESLDGLSSQDPEKTILIVGPYAFGDEVAAEGGREPVIGGKKSGVAVFNRYLAGGGRTIVLEQSSLAEIMPDLELVDHPSTMTFPVSPNHPLLEGLGADDLKFWRGDHYVSRREIRRPGRFGARAIAVSGGIEAEDQAPIVEAPVGRGLVVFCQALTGTKYDSEPAARRLVANAVDYLSRYKPPAGNVLAIIGEPGGDEFRRRLDDLGLFHFEPEKAVTMAEVNGAALVVLHGGGKEIETLAPILADHTRPLTVYWHAPEKESFEKLKAVLGLGSTKIADATGPLTLIAGTDTALECVLREDLAFMKPFGPDNWYRVVTPDASVVDRALTAAEQDTESETYTLEKWDLSGSLVQANDDRTVAFYTNGSATGEITIARDGLYWLALDGWGTPAEGGWPMVTVKADGRAVGEVVVAGRKERDWACLVNLKRGKVKLELAFGNDLYRDGEDRNLFIRRLRVSRAPVDLGPVKLLSLPPALAAARAKSRLRVLVDCVRWDTNADNRVRGMRFASALFASLGASFRNGRARPEWIDPHAFEPTGKIGVFSRTPTQLNFGSNGTVKAAFTCALAGKYEIVLRGFSTHAKGEYGKARVKIDGRNVGEVELDSPVTAEFEAGTVRLDRGRHELTVEFTNDLWLGPGKEDRNLYLNGAGFLYNEE